MFFVLVDDNSKSLISVQLLMKSFTTIGHATMIVVLEFGQNSPPQAASRPSAAANSVQI
jgi:hypothetical protein